MSWAAVRRARTGSLRGWIRITFVALIPLILLYPGYALGASDDIALRTDRIVYTIGMTVNVAGQVTGSFDPGSPAKITVSGPSGPYYSATVSLDQSGGFLHEFVIDGDSSLVGRHTLKATHQTGSGDASGTVSFEVKQRASITMSTDRSSYSLGDDVTLRGTVSPVLSDFQVLIQAYNPKNLAWSFTSVPASKISTDGQFSVPLGKLAGERSIAGTYKVRAFYAASTASAEITFEVGQAQQTGEGGGTQTSNAEKLKVVEESTSVSAAQVAEEAVVASEIKNTEQRVQEFTYIVLIKDVDGLTVSLSWAKGAVGPNESLTMGQSWIPEEPGEYTVEIFVWESLTNPVPLAGRIVKTVVVG